MALSFQDIIHTLHKFWGSHGCFSWHPYSEKVGAGTMNPGTVLSVLGPEPWNIAYAEPSYRPDDGRFGENPNRMQMHTQFQVILKPDPGNPQELYLKSLEAIGITQETHDIRFVEDNWESPALGAWGLGWEVWLNGMEITQFTYFQQSASQVLPVPAVEITYGLERIAMFLQQKDSVWDIDWNGQLTYRDILFYNEVDHCEYDFNVADIERLREIYTLFEAEALACIEKNLIVPAHDYVLRCSHTFNLLDARGAIGVTERAHYFGRMRDLARKVAEKHLEKREFLEYPLLKYFPADKELTVPSLPDTLNEAQDFILEIGVEELPSHQVPSIIEQLNHLVPQALKESRLDFSTVYCSGTPRRIILRVEQLAPKQPARQLEVKGPPARIAFDNEGKPTKAAEGFAKKNGVTLEQLTTVEEEKGAYLVASIHEEGCSSFALLQELIPEWLKSLKFPRSMRWNDPKLAFSRPVRWLVAIHQDKVVPAVFGDIVAGLQTRGPRFLDSPLKEVKNCSEYFQALDDWNIIWRREERYSAIKKQLTEVAHSVDGYIASEHLPLLDEVTDLVEVPHALLGIFSEDHLKLPECVLTTVMKKHQRYFPISNKDDNKLSPYFIAVAHGDRQDNARVIEGYQDVLKARYADADFFVAQDLGKSLDDFAQELSTLTFQEQLGSMKEKQDRIAAIAQKISQQLTLPAEDKTTITRASAILKADLATAMVVEITSLQGVLGEVYAEKGGESPAVGKAIREHYLPRFAGDSLPTEIPGAVLGLSDRLDTVTGMFSIGLIPTGSADPYGLRRAALGVIQILIEHNITLSLKELIDLALQQQPGEFDQEHVSLAVQDFISDRLLVWLKEQGIEHDIASACYQSGSPAEVLVSAQSLTAYRQQDYWSSLFEAYARCSRLAQKHKHQELSIQHDQEPATLALAETLKSFTPAQDLNEALDQLRIVTPKIETFFNEVMVMSDDPKLKEERLSVVQAVDSLPRAFANLSKLEGF